MGGDMNQYTFTKRSQNVPDAGIGPIMSYAAKYSDTISLGQGAPQFKTPQFVYDQLYEQSKTNPTLGIYNNLNDKTQLALKELLVTDFKSKYLFAPQISELYLTVGGIGGLFAALMVLLQKGDEVIFFDPSYPLHLSQISISEAKPVFVPLNESSGWTLDLELLKSKVTNKTKAIVLTNPNNPTGTVLSKDQIHQLAEIVVDRRLYLVLDEAYEYLTYDQPLYSPMNIPKLRDHIVLSKSFSKEYAMTGWRIGYLWANTEIIKKIQSIHLYFSLNPATIAVAAATIVLSDPQGKQAMLDFKAQITKSREVICQRMDRLTKLFSYQKPQGSFYLFPKIIPDIPAFDFAKKLVDEAKVITIPGDSMGTSGAHHLRMSFSANSKVINQAFDRLDQFAKDNNYS